MSSLSALPICAVNPSSKTLDLKGVFPLSDALLAHVPKMTCLKHVHINTSSGVTSRGIKCLYSLQQLESLELKGSVVTDSTLDGIGAARKTLKLLYLNRTCVSDSDLVHLTCLSSLKALLIYWCRNVTSAGMLLVDQLTGLEELYLFGSGVRDDGLQYLRPLTRLKLLVLPLMITDAGLRHIQWFPALEYLDSSGFLVSKDGVKLLRKLRSLKQVRVHNERRTRELVVDVLPHVQVSSAHLPNKILGD
ncbi:unnamed protein product [Closterium sp. NIES-53]